MTNSNVTDLTAAERRLLLAEVHEALRQECRGVPDRAKPLPENRMAEMDKHLEELVPIVRRSTAIRIEPYLAQILDDVCAKCPHQQPSGYCPLRYQGSCILYRHAGRIVAAMRRALREIDIGRELAARES